MRQKQLTTTKAGSRDRKSWGNCQLQGWKLLFFFFFPVFPVFSLFGRKESAFEHHCALKTKQVYNMTLIVVTWFFCMFQLQYSSHQSDSLSCSHLQLISWSLELIFTSTFGRGNDFCIKWNFIYQNNLATYIPLAGGAPTLLSIRETHQRHSVS